MYDFSLIGNCQISALIKQDSSIVWLCMPRPDSDPIFGQLLDPEGGFFSISLDGPTQTEQAYRPNTAILESRLSTDDGQKIVVTDFAPRFEQYGRMYRPAALMRVVEPQGGRPRIRVSCQPISGWTKEPLRAQRFNSHVRYEHPQGGLRLVTNIPLTYLIDGQSFFLDEPAYFALLWDMPLEDDLTSVVQNFLAKTERYWQTWVKHCTIPVLFQKEVIRSAITLKLHCYEDTGAILAATTTSMPETFGKERNWDYRFCWLRDTFFTLSAFNNLGHFEEMEGFFKFLINIVRFDHDLAPVYALDQSLPLPERWHQQWAGYMDSRPVRTGNAAALQQQHDAYGEMILTLAPIYFDERFVSLRSPHLNALMDWLTERCMQSIGQPDAGLWELRGTKIEHTFTNLMCWAGLDRVLKIRQAGQLGPSAQLTLDRIDQARQKALEHIRAATHDMVVYNSPIDNTLDASMLMMPILRFPDADSNRATVHSIASKLGAQGLKDDAGLLLYRYLREDDFGQPQDAFLVCSFWLAHAYATVGEKERGRDLLQKLTRYATPQGLYPEHVTLGHASAHSGNFPQTYSHVGLINAAFALSPDWREVL
ncbi:MAG TPA: glycoside hydrolase family 15 protein [Oligoflexus sp.]|uniref:glycoside hydrolase family 15 protein n=1 Tax=Oligoflexus sp. TaxID=1971216 RepID=UPI002D6B4677|nr:glycoside hydrolase family 15 protein [Oligoflexus sp.]HYX37608.1 glycoside hydrolase family 15 protein [Oligoflexus sp.]